MIGWNEKIKKSLKYCGSEVYIGQYVLFANPGEVVLHDRVRIDPFTLITTQLEVKSNVQICSHVVIGGGSKQKVTLGNWSFLGYGSQLFTGSEDYSGLYGPVNDFWFSDESNKQVNKGNITFDDYAGVASQVIVMPGVNLPMGTCIGAQSFVYSSKGLAPWKVYVGNPLKYLKDRYRYKVIELSMDKSKWKHPGETYITLNKDYREC